MARFIDLEVEDGGDDAQDPSSRFVAVPPPTGTGGVQESATTPTVCNAVTRAFQCYPIVVGVVSHIDLTTLDSLARASRLIRIGLVQYRAALVAATLHCANEHLPVDPDAGLRFRIAEVASDAASSAKKASRCARDMVGECRRCAAVICRNCTIKPPAASTLRERHRRLCAPCAKAPLERVACPGLDMSLPGSADAMRRSLCDCEAGGVWLCQPCGRDIRNADQDYLRIWRWRNHYGEVLGCLGTGIGDADRGVICGREDRCLASREREQEVDCDAEDARSSSSSSSSRTPSTSSEHHPATPTGAGSYFPVFAASTTTPPDPDSIEALVAEYTAAAAATAATAARTPSPPLSLGPGYARHEIEGIGGVVKRKLVRMVRVGRCVPEWEEERASVTRVLGREARGEARSWCGWCWRVVPGRGDLLPGEGASSSSLPLRPAAGTKTQSRPPLVPVLDVRAGA